MKIIKKIIIRVRDVFYNWILKSKGAEIATSEHESSVAGYFLLFYFLITWAIWLIFIPFLPSFSSESYFFLKNDIFANILGAIICFGPYYFIWIMMKKFLATVQIKKLDELTFRKEKIFVLGLFISGFLSILVLAAISNYFRFGHF